MLQTSVLSLYNDLAWITPPKWTLLEKTLHIETCQRQGSRCNGSNIANGCISCRWASSLTRAFYKLTHWTLMYLYCFCLKRQTEWSFLEICYWCIYYVCQNKYSSDMSSPPRGQTLEKPNRITKATQQPPRRRPLSLRPRSPLILRLLSGWVSGSLLSQMLAGRKRLHVCHQSGQVTATSAACHSCRSSGHWGCHRQASAPSRLSQICERD